jgi:putative addiction module CopG family antidote
MTVNLPPALEAWVENRVKNGLAASSEEVVGEALQLMMLLEQEQTGRFDRLKALIDAGLEDIEAGRVSAVTDGLIAEIKRQGKGRPFAGLKRANITALKLGMFNPTEELDKLNEGR